MYPRVRNSSGFLHLISHSLSLSRSLSLVLSHSASLSLSLSLSLFILILHVMFFALAFSLWAFSLTPILYRASIPISSASPPSRVHGSVLPFTVRPLVCAVRCEWLNGDRGLCPPCRARGAPWGWGCELSACHSTASFTHTHAFV